MFDGNYRSQRRNINLSGRPQRPARTSSGGNGLAAAPPSLIPLRTSVGEGIEDRKRQVLESTRKLREERRQQQRKESAAKQIQRYYRGWCSRKHLLHDIWTQLSQRQQQQQQPPPNVGNIASSPSVALLLSLLLSPSLLPIWKPCRSRPGQIITLDLFQQALLQHIPSTTDSQVSRQRILQTVLQELRPTPATYDIHFQNNYYPRLLQHAQAILQQLSPNESPVVSEQVFLALAQCTKEWLLFRQDNVTETSHEIIATLWKWSCGVQIQSNNSPEQQQQLQHALLATILLGWKRGVFRNGPTDALTTTATATTNTRQQQHPFGTILQQGGPDAAGSVAFQWVQELVDVMTQFKIAGSRQHLPSLLLSAIADNLKRRQNIVLSNVLDLCGTNTNGRYPPPDTLIRFIHHTFTQRPDVALLSSLAAGGASEESLRAMVGLVTTTTATAAMDTNNDEDDDDDDSLDEDDGLVRAPTDQAAVAAASAKASRSLAQQQRLTRQEVQTLPKLDRLYLQQVQQWRQQVLAVCKATASSKTTPTGLDSKEQLELLVDVALQLGNGSLWLEWGLVLFPAKASSSATMIVDDDDNNNNSRPHDLYLKCLFTLLQTSASLRPVTSSKSPLLSQLAFSQGFLEGLWHYFVSLRKDTVMNDSTTNGSIGGGSSQKQPAAGGDLQQEPFWCATNVMCHVFSHYLIALSDDEFLLKHTVSLQQMYQNAQPATILAEDAIALLRTMLHDLYWAKPVVAGDVHVPYLADRDENRDFLYMKSLRSCALMAGTKLWNSLYERWCRLVRTAPFCDESMWWFPRLVGDAGVVHYHSSRPPPLDSDDEGIDSMDVDDSSEEVMDETQLTMDAESEELAGAFRDPKMARILTSIPQALPFDRRVKMFHSLLATDKLKTQDEEQEFRRAVDRMVMMRGEGEVDDVWAPRQVVSIHRDNMYDDSMEQLNKLGPRLKQRVQITFINQHGTAEAGIDGGGVFKEFLDDLIKDAFVGDSTKPSKLDAPRLFAVTPLQTLSVNPNMTQDSDLLPHYEFLGRVLGKAVYESILVEPQFCLPFLNKLLGKPNSLEDLKNYDAEYYKNLIKLRSLQDDEINGLGLAFELNIGGGDKARTVELIPGGRTTAVTKENLSQYVHLVAHYMLNVQGAPQTRAFLRGFRDLIPASWVRLFSSYELQKVIGGDDSVRGIDVASLKQSMQYSAGYHPSQPIIEWFWEVVAELTPDQQRKLLKFMTSCSRQPLLGFHSLEPAPCIQQIRIAEDVFRGDDETVAKRTPLPTSSTCMNLLKLPNYRSKDLLRKKLLDAIEAGAGFELT